MNASGITLSSLSIFDWALIGLLIVSTVRAFLRGFLLEAFSIGGLIGGILLASWFYADLAAKLIVWTKSFTTLAFATADIIAFLAILFAVMVVGSLLGKFLRSGATAVGLGFIDRSLGAIFGLARGCLLVVACLMVFTAFDPSPGLLKNSHLLPYFLAGTRGVSFVVPGTLQQQLADGADRIKHSKPVWIKPPQ